MPYKDKQKQKEAQARINLEIRRNAITIVNAYKTAKGCYFCGNKEPLVLDLHHRDPETKLENVASLVNKAVKIDRVLDEMKKCEVVCANCHRLLHAGLLSL